MIYICIIRISRAAKGQETNACAWYALLVCIRFMTLEPQIARESYVRQKSKNSSDENL